MAMKWFGPKVIREVERKNKIRVKRAAQYITQFAKGKLSTEGNGLPSPRGGYPYKQTGDLRNSIGYEMILDGKKAIWGTNLEYGRFLEENLDRKWMSITNNDPVVQAMLKRILGGGL